MENNEAKWQGPRKCRHRGRGMREATASAAAAEAGGTLSRRHKRFYISWQQERLYHGGRLRHGVEVGESPEWQARLPWHEEKFHHSGRLFRGIEGGESPVRLYHGGLQDSIIAERFYHSFKLFRGMERRETLSRQQDGLCVNLQQSSIRCTRSLRRSGSLSVGADAAIF